MDSASAPALGRRRGLHRSARRPPSFVTTRWRPAFLALFLAAVAVRPIVDLFGSYEQGAVINPGGALGIVAALFCAAFALGFRGRMPVLPLVATIAYGALVVVAAVQVVANGAPELASLARLIVGFAPLLLLATCTPAQRRAWRPMVVATVCAVVVLSCVPVVIAFLQLAGVVPFTYFDYIDGVEFGRPSGGYLQPNSLARLMVFGVLMLGLLVWSGRARLRTLGPLLLLFAVTAVLTTHRTSLVALVFVVIVLLATEVMARGRVVRRRALGSTLLSATLVVAALAFGTAVAPDRLEAVARTTTAVIGEGLATLSGAAAGDGSFLRGRGAIWRDALGAYRDGGTATMVFGLGYEPLEAHNDGLRILLVHGAAGLVSYAVVFVALFVWAWRTVTYRGKAGLVAVFGFLSLYAVPLHPTAYPFFMWLFFLCVWLILVLFEANPAPDRSVAVS